MRFVFRNWRAGATDRVRVRRADATVDLRYRLRLQLLAVDVVLHLGEASRCVPVADVSHDAPSKRREKKWED